MLLYYITDRSQFPGDEAERRRSLLDKISEAARAGVDFIQLREKDLTARQLETLAREALQTIAENAPKSPESTLLFVNSRADVALAAGADGVHLRADDVSPADICKMLARCGSAGQGLQIAVSCHTADEVARAAGHADFAVFGPVFEKKQQPQVPAAGLDALREACRQKIKVLAIGGVTMENAAACLNAGAAGIAAIRLFQENEIAEVVRRLRS